MNLDCEDCQHCTALLLIRVRQVPLHSEFTRRKLLHEAVNTFVRNGQRLLRVNVPHLAACLSLSSSRCVWMLKSCTVVRIKLVGGT